MWRRTHGSAQRRPKRLDSLRSTGDAATVATRMHEHEVEVDEPLVRRLLTSQMPHLAGHALSIVEPWGTDNGIWRLGGEFVVRLPRIAWAVGQIARTHRV